MKIEKIIVPWQIQDKLMSKHQVVVDEARQALLNNPRIRFAEKGHQPGKMFMQLSAKPLAVDI